MNENISQEFNQKYCHTYLMGSVDGGQTYIPVYIRDSQVTDNPTSKSFSVVCLNILSKDRFTVPFNTITFDYQYPKLGYINVQNQALMFVARKSERQFKKGPCDQTLAFFDPAFRFCNALVAESPKYGLKKYYISSDDLDPMTKYQALFQQTFMPVPRVINQMMQYATTSKLFGLPLNRQWAVSLSPNNKFDLLLHREMMPVGLIKLNQNESDFTTQISEIYYQEWADFCQRKGLTNVRIELL